mgnify:CR=1 FL=1
MHSYDKLEYIRTTLQHLLCREQDGNSLLIEIPCHIVEHAFHINTKTVKQALEWIDDLKYESEVKG